MMVNRHRLNRGQSLVEVALLLPVVLVLAIVTFDLGRGVYYYSAIYNAAREGARYGIVHQQPYNTIPVDFLGIQAAARAKAVGLDLNKFEVEQPTINGDMLQVTVKYDFYPVTPVTKLVTKCRCDYFTLSSTSTMLIER